MRNLIYIIILLFSTNINAQSQIENDPLFIKYEQEYFVNSTSSVGREYEQAKKNFYTIFKDHKDRAKFEKIKDKERWLSKNYSKLNLNSAEEALALYNTLLDSKAIIDGKNKAIQEIRNELLKRYDVNLIWETLQNRIKARK